MSPDLISDILIFDIISHTVSVLRREKVYTMKYSVSPRAKPEGFPKGSGYISMYDLT